MRKVPDTGDLVLRPLLLLGDRGVDDGVERVIDGLHGGSRGRHYVLCSMYRGYSVMKWISVCEENHRRQIVNNRRERRLPERQKRGQWLQRPKQPPFVLAIVSFKIRTKEEKMNNWPSDEVVLALIGAVKDVILALISR